MTSKIRPTIDRVKDLLSYDPSSGLFTWLKDVLCGRGRPVVRAGEPAGYLNPVGYVEIGVDGRRYYAHILALAYVREVWPTSPVDHRNGIRDDNSYTNLREVTQLQNCNNHANRPLRPGKTSSKPGVFLDKKHHRWRSEICVDGKRTSLGSFKTEEEAHQAYLSAKQKALKELGLL